MTYLVVYSVEAQQRAEFQANQIEEAEQKLAEMEEKEPQSANEIIDEPQNEDGANQQNAANDNYLWNDFGIDFDGGYYGCDDAENEPVQIEENPVDVSGVNEDENKNESDVERRGIKRGLGQMDVCNDIVMEEPPVKRQRVIDDVCNEDEEKQNFALLHQQIEDLQAKVLRLENEISDKNKIIFEKDQEFECVLNEMKEECRLKVVEIEKQKEEIKRLNDKMKGIKDKLLSISF